MEPIAYLTVEIKHRDLDSRLLIASHLVSAGYTVMVGSQWSIFANSDSLPPGVVLFKTVNDIQAGNMASCRKYGHFVAATDEEVLMCVDDMCFTLAFGPRAAANCDLFLAQSDAHRDAIQRKYPDFAGKIDVIGNPRIDMMSPNGRAMFAPEAEECRRQHGRYVLFNTNYGSINTIWKGGAAQIAQIAVKAGVLNPNDQKSIDDYNNYILWETNNRKLMVKMIQWAAANLADHKIVIRPHPGEVAGYWVDLASKLPRTVVIPRSNPHPWILGADLVVHTGCTTGLEAILLGVPAVNVMSGNSPYFDRMVRLVNPTFYRWEEAAAAIGSYFADKSGPIVNEVAEAKNVLERYFPHYRDGDSARTIADRLLGVFAANGVKPDRNYEIRLRPPGFRKIERPEILRDKLTATRDEVLAAFGALRGLSGQAGLPQVHEVDDSLFVVRS